MRDLQLCNIQKTSAKKQDGLNQNFTEASTSFYLFLASADLFSYDLNCSTEEVMEIIIKDTPYRSLRP